MAVRGVNEPTPGPAAAPPALAVHGLEVAYGASAPALRGVGLEVPAGAAVALLGANGAGKTTTIRAISGVLGLHSGRITAGSVELGGTDVTRTGAHRIVRHGLAQVPEGRMVFAGLTVEENLRVGAVTRADRAGIPDAIERLLDLFGQLRRRRHDQAGWLSGGEQQMLAIGRALMAEPRVLLLDEVSLGLAPMITRTIFDRLAEVRAATGAAMLVVEQNARLALDFCDHAYVLDGGRVVLAGPAGELRGSAGIDELYLGGAAGADDAPRVRRTARWLT